MMTLTPGDRVHILLEDGKEYLVNLQNNQLFSTHLGSISHNEMLKKEYGDSIRTNQGHIVYLLLPGIVENIRFMERQTQVMYPKDIGYILLYLDIKNGDRVIDVGLGSGAMCGALARMVGVSGQIFGYERRQEFAAIAERNLVKWNLKDRVTIRCRDMADGFEERDVDALFLDVPDPWEHIDTCWNTLKGGGRIGIACPTAGKAIKTLEALEKIPFLKTEVWETLIREYKNSPHSFRPVDRMIAHTTYLLFSRKINNRSDLSAQTDDPEKGFL
ncbi:MAG TPA: tRNA (adenine-N1)-methyltransferase [Atribacteraceae bacterium]|nr:tRNA (adenine-N1)-methyltransferase [Atribacteraceae bacterium]